MKYKILPVLGWLLLGLTIIFVGLWGTLAFFYAGPSYENFRYLLSAGFGIASLATFIMLFFPHWRRKVLGGYALLFVIVLAWYSTLTPSNDRVWKTDVALLPYVTQQGHLYTVHNVRNFSYRSEDDFTPAYYDRTYDLDKLTGVDIIAVYWMGPAIAHVFVSFSFSDGKHLAVSIETRTEEGEGYSTLRGFFRQYELYYVVADERDVIGLRTNYRFSPQEDVYIYPMYGSLADAHHLFLNYVKKINALKKHPEFYNTLTTNCTTNIWLNAKADDYISSIPFSWKILASGYVPEYLYEHNRLYTEGLSFEELRKKAYANDRAKAYGIGKDFSKRIRGITPPR